MIEREADMEIYSINFEYLLSLFNDIWIYFVTDFTQKTMFFSILVLLASMLSISRKVHKLEKKQDNDIDDITSYSRLIDDEIGVLRFQQDKLHKEIKNSKLPVESKSEIGSEGKLFHDAPYTQAVQLAKRGYAREDIISLCSLTDSEAELILTLHSNSKAA